jgi:hypothetical protein
MAQPISKCVICDDILRNSLGKYCRRCGNILERVGTRGKIEETSRVKALKNAWDTESECFRCYYSGIKLADDNPRDPRYITFDNSLEQECELIVVGSLIYDMKSGLPLDEFKAIVIQLGRHFADGSPVDEIIFKAKPNRR